MQKKIEATENLRKSEQDKVDSSKSKKDRNKLGQFSTPRKLADEILAFAKEINIHDTVRFLDPAFGMGSFYTGLLKTFGQNTHANGFEIDADYFHAAKNVWKDYEHLSIENKDFLALSPSDYQQFNLLVCNPPYIRHQHLDPGAKLKLQNLTEQNTGIRPSGLSGLHVYFMLLCHQWLEQDGLAIWLVPAEILEVNYGKKIRDYLLSQVKLERIHFFEHTDEQFSDALVSSCIIVYRKTQPDKDNKVAITLGSNFVNPDTTFSTSNSELSHYDKWSKHLLTPHSATEIDTSSLKLGDYFSIKRGIATGDNNFFILDKEKALELEVPRQFLRNILPPSRYLKGNVIRFDSDGFLDTEKKLVLLDTDLPIEQIKKLYPKLYAYLVNGMNNGVDKGYLASRRSPWYSQEKRTAPKYFVRYMNREKSGGDLSRDIFIKNETDAIAANSYLMLYEKPAELFGPTHDEEKIWSFLSKGLAGAHYKYGRTYGGGLVKFEPSELRNIPLAV